MTFIGEENSHNAKQNIAALAVGVFTSEHFEKWRDEHNAELEGYPGTLDMAIEAADILTQYEDNVWEPDFYDQHSWYDMIDSLAEKLLLDFPMSRADIHLAVKLQVHEKDEARPVDLGKNQGW